MSYIHMGWIDDHIKAEDAHFEISERLHGYQDKEQRAYLRGLARGIRFFVHPPAHGYLKRAELFDIPVDMVKKEKQ